MQSTTVATKTMAADIDVAQEILHTYSGPWEVRVLLKDGGALSGVFDDYEALKRVIEDDDQGVLGWFWTFNGLFESVNVTNMCARARAIGNADVETFRFIMIDVDPTKAGDMATEAERGFAMVVFQNVVEWLESKGIKPALSVSTGNGFHVLVKVDSLPTGEPITHLIKTFLKIASDKFATAEVKIDTCVARPACHTRIPGAVNRKGDDPSLWREVTVLHAAPDVAGLSFEQLKAFIAGEGYATEPPPMTKKKYGKLHPEFDAYDYAKYLGFEIVGEHTAYDGRQYLHSARCPNIEGEHTPHGETRCCLIIGGEVPIAWKCHSPHCDGEGITIKHLMDKAREESGPYEGPLWLEPDDVFEVEDILPDEEPEPETQPTKPKPRELTLESFVEDFMGPQPMLTVEECLYTVDTGEEKVEPFAVESNPAELTDVGNGARFASQYGNYTRKCYEDGKWYLWNGKRWKADYTNHIFKLAKETARSILKEAHDADNDEKRDGIIGWYCKSNRKAGLEAMVWSAQSEGTISIRSDAFDKNHNLLNFPNGTLDLETMTLRPHRRSDMITKLIPVPLDPNAACPTWDKFMLDIMQDNLEKAKFLQRMAGYSLCGDTSEQCFILMYGTGSNGKGTFINTLRHIMGDYAAQASFDSFAVTKNKSETRNDLAALVGKRLVSASEAEATVRLSEAVIKTLTGCDPITVRFLHHEWFEYVPTFKIWLSTNYKPRIVGTDEGIWRRPKLVSFNAFFNGANKDKNLPAKLMAERAGILNWLIEGYKEWKRIGLATPVCIEQETMAYRSEQDSLKQFIEAKCETGDWQKGCTVMPTVLYEAYKRWVVEAGEYEMSNRKFKQAMEERGWECAPVKFHGKVGKYWKGIRVIYEALPGVEDA